MCGIVLGVTKLKSEPWMEVGGAQVRVQQITDSRYRSSEGEGMCSRSA